MASGETALYLCIGKGTAKWSCEPLARKAWLGAAADGMSKNSGIDAQIGDDGSFCRCEPQALPTGKAA